MSRSAPAPVSALVRGIAVLQCLRGDTPALSNGEISRMTALPKATVARLATTLVSLGLLRQDQDTEKYALGPGVLSFSAAFLAALDIRVPAQRHLRKLAEATGATAYLAVPDGEEMVLIEACRARAPLLTMSLDVGARVPVATSSLGRAYLAALEATEHRRIPDQACCTSIGELRPEINSIALPLLLADGKIAAINCGGPAFSFPEAKLRTDIAPQLLAAAQSLAREIGATLPTMTVQPESKAA